MATGYLDNFYARLGIPQMATHEEIRAAYHKAARRFHPDHNPEKGTTEIFLLIQEAYETLSNPVKRLSYDELLPKDVTSQTNILINTVYSRQTLTSMDRPQLLYVMLNLMALPEAKGTQPARQPLNVSIVLDTSTSMSGPRLDTVKATAIQIVRSLKAMDILSVVTFNDRAEVIVPAMKNQTEQMLEARISLIQTSGGTEIGKGLEAGYQEIMNNMRPKYNNHIILVTDGRTYGDEDVCLEISKAAKEQGIAIHALGIGSKWNDEFIDELTTKTGGSSGLAQTPEAIKRFLENKFGRIQNTYANNVSLSLKTPESVELRYVFRLSPDSSSIPINGAMSLGDIPKQQSMSLLMEFMIDSTPTDLDMYQLVDGEITYLLPTAPVPNVTSRLTFSRPISETPRPEPPPQVLVRAMSRLSLYRLQEMAQKDLGEGKVRKATQRLKNLATQLLSSGEADLARTVMLELDQIRANQGMSDEARKRIKYGTRALVMENIEKLKDK